MALYELRAHRPLPGCFLWTTHLKAFVELLQTTSAYTNACPTNTRESSRTCSWPEETVPGTLIKANEHTSFEWEDSTTASYHKVSLALALGTGLGGCYPYAPPHTVQGHTRDQERTLKNVSICFASALQNVPPVSMLRKLRIADI